MKLTLVGNNVMLQPLPKRLRTVDGIHLPAKYQDDNTQYRVIAVGPGRVVRKKGKPDVVIPIELEPGDHVLTPQIHGNKYCADNGTIIIEADEIIAKWKP